MCRGADKRTVGRRLVGRVESGSQGVGRESNGGSAAILELAHVQAKVLRREWGVAQGWFSAAEAGAWVAELASGRVG